MENKIIETPIGKHKVELKCWLTGRDRRAIQSVYYEGFDISVNKENPEIKGIKGSLINKAQDKTFEIIVLSIDGKKENIVDRILDMNDKDFDFVVDEINKITEKKTA